MLDFIFIAAFDVWNETAEIIAALNKSVSALAGELELLFSLYIAHFIVWRELRKRGAVAGLDNRE